MKRPIATVLALVGVCALVAVLAQEKRGPSTAEERAAIVELAKKLQENPLDASLQGERDRLVMVLVEAPDLSGMTTCGDEMPWLKGKFKYANELITVHLISTAAYVVSHQQADEKQAHLAGLEGAIKAYQAIVGREPKATIICCPPWNITPTPASWPRCSRKDITASNSMPRRGTAWSPGLI